MVGGAASAFISRRLWAAQTRALREHRIDPSGIPVGCTTIGSRHGVSPLSPEGLGGFYSLRATCGAEKGTYEVTEKVAFSTTIWRRSVTNRAA